jgi:DKNYY family
MKIVFILILGLILVVIFFLVFIFKNRLGKPVNEAVSDSYYFDPKGNKIIYSPMGNTFELGYTETEADAALFIVLSRYAGKDSKTVYWKGKKTQADPASFIIDSNRTPKDDLHVYFPGDSPDSLYVIEGADPKTYEPLPTLNNVYYHYWAQDTSSIFLDGKKVDADRATFVRLNTSIATDVSSIYSIEPSGTLTVGNPGATILVHRGTKPAGEAKAINESYARIGQSIAFSGWKNKFALLTFDQINSIRVVDERNIFIDNVLVSDGKKIEGIDGASLEIIQRDYFKDKNGVYYDGEKIPLANPQTFVVVHEEYSKDDQRVFYKTQVLEGAKPNTFTIDYASGIASDGNLSFKEGVLFSK